MRAVPNLWASFVVIALVASCGLATSGGTDLGWCLPDSNAPVSGDFAYTSVYQVVDGDLGLPCHGDIDRVVEDAWDVFVDIVPREQRVHLDAFAGFNANESSIAAFVQPLDRARADFFLAVNIAALEWDPRQTRLTMAHEFAHVFTLLPSEIDYDIDADDCPNYHNGHGCFRADSIINQWFERFWTLMPGDPTNPVHAPRRCALDGGFFGRYAATSPEEDFAETFSAYVLQVRAVGRSQIARRDWVGQVDGMREFRDRAAAAGHGPYRNSYFPPCDP